MIALRLLLVLIFSPLLSSCDMKSPVDIHNDIQEIKSMVRTVVARLIGDVRENPCIAGVPQTEDCYYVLTITEVKDNLVQGKTSKLVCEHNRDYGNPFEDCEKFVPAPRWFTFNGAAKQLEVGKHYDLFGHKKDPPTNELTCHDKDDKPTTTCLARTQPIPPPKS